MKLVRDKITVDELLKMADKMERRLVKAVIDIEQEIMVVDAPMHVDQELFLIDEGSDQGDLWGINLFPDVFGTENFLEFDSMINLRPSWGNRTRGVDDPKIQERIKKLIKRMVVL